MRRKSERNKSVESPAPASRRTSRRSGRTSSVSESEKNSEDAVQEQSVKEETQTDGRTEDSGDEQPKESQRRNRGSRKRTPTKESVGTSKRRNQRAPTPDVNIPSIPEEENGSTEGAAEEIVVNTVVAKDTQGEEEEKDSQGKAMEVGEGKQKLDDDAQGVTETTVASPASSSEVRDQDDDEENVKTLDVLEIQVEDQEKEKDEDMSTISRDEQVPYEVATENSVEQHDSSADDTEVSKDTNTRENPSPIEELVKKANLVEEVKISPTRETVKATVSFAPNLTSTDNGRKRKRRWLTNKVTESKAILAISTDSLKDLIADVHPVPLSDVQLDSSSDVEEVTSEREEGEETPSPDYTHRRGSVDKIEKREPIRRSISENVAAVQISHSGVVTSAPKQRDPSPARNNASNVLYITNLVRPFTLLQLKGLLARTGKIVENGFWIDRIKSKCYVQYETEDEAIETRHALHGVRWPVSNPKCLNVDFGLKKDMERAIQSTKDDGQKFAQDSSKDNFIVGTGWSKDRNEVEDKKSVRPVREWDVGKKVSLEHEKARDSDKPRRSRERERDGDRENDKNDRDRKRVRDPKSSSFSPVNKLKKKENEPPLRLLDDLFRKTKATPCIYWLPLTPEQIAEKEAFRQRRIEEKQQRIKQRELEREQQEREREQREKEREKEREREREAGRDKERSRNNDRSDRGRDRDRDNRDHRRSNRSSDRRRSRSRDRRH